MKQAQLKRIRQAEDANRPADTVRLATGFLRAHPDHAPTWILLGRSLIEMARYSEARRALLRAITFCPTDKRAIALAQMGHLYNQRGSLTRAAHWYGRAIGAAPKEADGYIYLGSMLAKRGKLKEAESQYLHAVRCDSGCIDEAYLNLGLVLRAQQRYPEASAALKRAIQLTPSYREAAYALADVESMIRANRKVHVG